MFRTLFVAAAIIVAAPALAFDAKPFDAQAFAAAQAAGKSILVEVHAPWCPTCKAQAPILSKLSAAPKFKGIVAYRVDFDSQKDALKALGVRQQSTLIAYKGKAETGRSVGSTDPAAIEMLVGSAI
ncbi:MAG: thioredoxin family protein [Rhizobiales bacterium]|nr:thioredoxin family protein [Hyphomicrobiales bacterium]